MGRNGNDVFVLGEESLAADDLEPRGEDAADFALGDIAEHDSIAFAPRSRIAEPLPPRPRFPVRRRLALLALGAAVAAVAVALFRGVGASGGDSAAPSASLQAQAQAPALVVKAPRPQDSLSQAVSRAYPVARQPVHAKRKQHKLKKRPRGGPEREPNSEPAPVGPPVDAPVPTPVPLPVPAAEPAPVSSPPDPSPPPTGGGGSVARPEFGFER